MPIATTARAVPCDERAHVFDPDNLPALESLVGRAACTLSVDECACVRWFLRVGRRRGIAVVFIDSRTSPAVDLSTWTADTWRENQYRGEMAIASGAGTLFVLHGTTDAATQAGPAGRPMRASE